MKDFFKYCTKHLPTIITLIITIGFDIYLNVNKQISLTLAENIFLFGLITLNLSFLFDFTRNLDEMDKKVVALSKTFPDTLIETFSSVDLVSYQLKEMVEEGPHELDLVFFDTGIRTSDPAKVSKMSDFVKFCTEKPSIRVRLAFVPSADSICERIDNIIESEKKHSNSFFAYQESSITFASFMVIDKKYVSIRTPHKNGSKSLYCIVKEADLCELYSSWFEILWEESVHVNKNELPEFIEKYKVLIPNDKYNSIKKSL